LVTILVVISFLHAGSSSITLTSNSPKNANAIDLGIGVADICKICGLQCCFKNDLCLTQNLCCSSIITYWSDAKDTVSCKSACVHTIKSICQFASCCLVCSFSFAVSFHDRSATRTPKGKSIFAIELTCCCASTDSGTKNATCPPKNLIIYRAVMTATMVFHDQTSHWSNLIIV